jgi:hypothetical protein
VLRPSCSIRHPIRGHLKDKPSEYELLNLFPYLLTLEEETKKIIVDEEMFDLNMLFIIDFLLMILKYLLVMEFLPVILKYLLIMEFLPLKMKALIKILE